MAFLEDAMQEHSFLRRMQVLYGRKSEEYKQIEWAEMLTQELFCREKRLNGEPYVTHPRSVALIAAELAEVKDYRVIIGCIIHDNREHAQAQGTNSLWSSKFVESWFGEYIEWLLASQTMPHVHKGVTKEKAHEVYHKNVRSLCHRRDFFEVKLSDRLHNLWTLSPKIMSPEKIRRKIEETRIYYAPYAARHNILIQELREALEWLEEEDNNNM